jgi:pimeloyl-ACP methyl ester carboxylesterase
MRGEVVDGAPFGHAVFTRAGRPSRALHVYLDGDGTPWRAWRPASDPTPRNPLVLRLMALDPEPSIYLGRPCYHGLSDSAPCTSALWTRERYSEAVVSSMAVALRRMLAARECDRLVWFGYSGGGTLAMLLAPRFSETTDLVTLAANLDVDAWADLHGYTRLLGSLNPARRPPLPAWIRQRHYVGGEDRVVPQELAARGPIAPGTLTVIPSYDHICCWEKIWPDVLARVSKGDG